MLIGLMTGLDEVEGSLSERKIWEFFKYRKKEEALLIDQRIRRKGISVVHDLLKIARISKIESGEILGFRNAIF